MKAAFWISVVLCALAALSVFSDKGSGGARDGWVLVSRVLSVILGVAAGFLALGIKKKKPYGWWIGAVLLWLLTVSFLANILNITHEDDLAFVIWIVVSQLLCAAIPAWIFFGWWKPKKKTYFKL